MIDAAVPPDDCLPAIVVYDPDGRRAHVFHPRKHHENLRLTVRRLRMRGFDAEPGKGSAPLELVRLRDAKPKRPAR